MSGHALERSGLADANALADTLVIAPPRRRPLLGAKLGALAVVRVQAILAAAVLFTLELLARADLYGLRVTGDAPSYIGLLYRLAQHPLQSVNAYFPGVETSHAAPDLQLAALAWRATHGSKAIDPVAAYRLLALFGIASTALLLHATFVWVRRHAGSRAAWISIPVLLALFGPAHVIWAGDISLHGLMYGSFYSQTLGLALALYCLTALETRRTSLVLLAVPLLAATMTVHPFTGLMLAFFVSLRGCVLAVARRQAWWTGTVVIAAGYALGSLWPCYSLADALAVGGVRGSILVATIAAMPLLAWALPARIRRLPQATASLVPYRWSTRTVTATAAAGLLAVAALIAWEASMVWGPAGASWARLDVYWVDHLGRWPLLLASGLVGVLGLLSLARRGKPLPLLWLGTFYALGAVGALGVPIPLWYRLVLLCQPPLVLGVAVVAADRNRRAATWLVAATLTMSLGFSVYTFVGMSDRTTYFGGGWIPDAFQLGQAIPPRSGGVISDPETSYYIPAATGARVLTVTTAHVGSKAEQAAASKGYAQLQALYRDRGSDWWSVLRTLWDEGFRYVVVAHSLSIRPMSLTEFSDHTPALQPGADRSLLGHYFWALNRVGTLVADSKSFAVYRLDGARIR